MTKMPKLIGLCGAVGAGKSTVAGVLERVYYYERYSFATPLKEMLRTLGLSYEQLYGEEKETPSPLLLGKTPREAMQSLGTGWGREFMGQDFWVNIARDRLYLLRHLLVVIDDVRFPNEVQTIHKMGGVVWEVLGTKRPKTAIDSHISEGQFLETDATLLNDTRNPGDIERQVDRALKG